MCILLTTNANKDFPLVLLSNRDEYFRRATQNAQLHDYEHQKVLSPLDLARKDRGTWLAVNPSNKKLAVLVNFREGIRECVNPISRGVLPLDYVTIDYKTTKNQFLNELMIKYGDTHLFEQIGGFNLLFGDLINNRYDIISNKNQNDFKIFSNKDEYHGLSNSAFDEPWNKVLIGKERLQKLTEDYNTSVSNSKDEFIDSLFELLSTNTLDNITEDFQANYLNLKNSIFIPPLLVRDYNRNNELAGKYYGTRTQTIILVDKNLNLTYIEKNLHSSDDLNEIPQVLKYVINLNNDNSGSLAI